MELFLSYIAVIGSLPFLGWVPPKTFDVGAPKMRTPPFPLDDDVKFPLEFFHLHQIFYTTSIKLSRAVKIGLIHKLHNTLFSLRYYKRCQTNHTQS